MKKLIPFLVLGLSLASSQATILRTNLSFINPLVVSILLTNNPPGIGIGVTNLNLGLQSGGVWTNGVGNATANGLNMTNYVNTTNTCMYTQIVVSASASSPSGLLISGTNLPGILVVDVNTNLTPANAGNFGIPPFSASNLTWAKTNDALNLFQDVYFPNDWSPAYGINSGPGTTNLTSNMAIEVQLLGNQLTGTGNGSNYVTLVFSPLAGDGTQSPHWFAGLNAANPVANGVFPCLSEFTLLVTNAIQTTSTLNTFVFPIPSAYAFGASGLRLVSATPGAAWGTGGAMWLTRCRLILISAPL